MEVYEPRELPFQSEAVISAAEMILQLSNLHLISVLLHSSLFPNHPSVFRASSFLPACGFCGHELAVNLNVGR